MSANVQGDLTEFKLRIRTEDPKDLQAAREAAEETLIELEEEPRVGVVEPVTFVLAVGGAIALGGFVLDWWHRRGENEKGGVVIDLREGAKDQIYRDKDLPFGFVVTFMQDGKVTIEIKDTPKDLSAQLLGDIVSGAFKTLKDVAEAAAKVVGGNKVKMEPAGG